MECLLFRAVVAASGAAEAGAGGHQPGDLNTGSSSQVQDYHLRYRVIVSSKGLSSQVQGHHLRCRVVISGTGSSSQVQGHHLRYRVIISGAGSSPQVRGHHLRYRVIISGTGSLSQVYRVIISVSGTGHHLNSQVQGPHLRCRSSSQVQVIISGTSHHLRYRVIISGTGSSSQVLGHRLK